MGESNSTLLTHRFNRALVYAEECHHNHVRKGTGIPYISHLLQVAGLVLEYGGNEDQAIAALLHDAVEDRGLEVSQICKEFGSAVATIVEGCTDTLSIHEKSDGGTSNNINDKTTRTQSPRAVEPEKAPWRPRKEAYIARIRHEPESIRLVSAADKLHNARAILKDYRVLGDGLFARFKGGKAGTFWYYRALIDVFRETGTNCELVSELNRVVTEVEALAYRDC